MDEIFRLVKIANKWVKYKVPAATLTCLKNLAKDQRYVAKIDKVADHVTRITYDIAGEVPLARLNKIIGAVEGPANLTVLLEKTANLPSEIRVQFFDELGKLSEEISDQAIKAFAKEVGLNASNATHLLDEFAAAPNKAKWFEGLIAKGGDIIKFKEGEALSVFVNSKGESFNCIVESVRTGTNGKYAVIGRSMAPVRKVADDIKALNLEVKILDDTYLNGMKFKLNDYDFTLPSGKKIAIKEGYPFYDEKGNIVRRLKANEEWTVDMAWQDMKYNRAYDEIKDANGIINNIDDLKNLPMYKVNNQWIEKMKNEGYEILNIGNPTKESPESLFYNMEKSVMNF